MSLDRAALGAHLRLSFAAGLTTWAAMFSWRGFSMNSVRFLYPLLVIAAVIALVGALARWRRAPAVLTLLLTVVAGTVAACVAISDSVVPDAAFWSALDRSVDAANTFAAPVPTTETITVQPLLIVGGAVAMVLVDLLAGTLRRAPLAGLPLLTVYSVPISMLEGGLSWWVFVVTAMGFLLMLFLQEQQHLGRWGRSLDVHGESSHRLSDAVRASSAGIGSMALAAAVLVPLVVPTLELQVFDIGKGPGGGDKISIKTPLADLRRDLARGVDIPLIQVETDDPSPDHLRISVLNRFAGNEWSPGDRDVPTTNLPVGDMPPLQGVGDRVSRTPYDYEVSIDPRFDSGWLPTQAPITSIDAEGDWRYDASTMDFLASGDDDQSTAGMRYSMTGVQLDFEPDAAGQDSTSVGLSPEVTALPTDLPDVVSSLARQVTAGASTSFDKATVLQKWFREDGGFEYDLTPEEVEESEVGNDELVAFLRDDEDGRRGYCEQFAAAMAVMARSLNIPARVAVGFLQPERIGATLWEYSAHDLHAWVELYFPGVGWVLFDPTPGGRGGRVPNDLVPAYTEARAPVSLPTVDPSDETRDPRPQQPSQSASDRPIDQSGLDQADADSKGGLGDLAVGALAVLLVLALVAAVAVLPGLRRRRLREQRACGGPEPVWEELRATCIDLGLAWPELRSPSETEEVVAAWFGDVGGADERPAHGAGQAPEAVESLARIVRQLERLRYARDYVGERGALHADLLVCVAALEAGVPRRVARRATWWPRSIWQRGSSVGPVGSTKELDPAGSVVEHI